MMTPETTHRIYDVTARLPMLEAGSPCPEQTTSPQEEASIATCVSRRNFILFAGATTVGLAALGIRPNPIFGAQPQAARIARYPRRVIAHLDDVRAIHESKTFFYPYDHPNCNCMVVRLGRPAGGGIGRDQDIVAFSQICSHQGGLLEGQYNAEHAVAGPCPLHLTTFDLTHHGMVVAGHATESLPQVILEIKGDQIIATGVLGLIYGFADNRMNL